MLKYIEHHYSKELSEMMEMFAVQPPAGGLGTKELNFNFI